tara:strand:+ start:549 stop:1013 length:465 start_codon:yes stop_codon:yes gene_type:complete
MANGKKSERSVLDSVGDFFGSMANDISIGLGMKRDPGLQPDNFIGPQQQTDYQRRTAASVARSEANQAYYGSNNDNSGVAQSNRYYADLARRSAMSSAAAPSLPNADAVGETEQALLDANKKGRSSTIATSPAGLLAGDESTRKKRSLMGGLIR